MAQTPAVEGRKTVRVVRTDTPPVIDGKLDDAVWARGGYLDDFHQVNPVEYAPPSERTEIWLLYDDDALYVGAKLHDSEPDKITANMLRQGGNITQDDLLFVTLDPFNDGRSGYFFGVNPNGVRFDGLYRNVSEYYTDWDGIYHAAAGRFEGGWIAEFEIPFKTLSFDPTSDAWGLNFSRSVQRRNEDIAWTSRNRRWDPSTAGLAVGFEGLQQGLGLDVVPSVSLSNARTFSPGTSDSSLEPSLDVFYKITPALNAALTVNTDFSATEVDDRQVNLTRFSLFFPEKRDFFLREADIFEFGRIGAQDGNGAISNAERQNARPFFSRRIGLSPTGERVDIEQGGKVSGRVGRWELGALSIRQDEYLVPVPAEEPAAGGPPLAARCEPVPGTDRCRVAADTLSVVRARAGLFGESTLGLVATHGDPSSNLDNSLTGVDFLYRNSQLSGGRVLEASAWYQQSDTEGLVGDDSASGVSFSIPSNAGFRGGFATREIERNFNPALGFVSRTGVRDYSGHIAYTHRPSGGRWQSLYVGADVQRIEVLGGGLQSQSVGFWPFELTNQAGDVIYWRSNFDKEVLAREFTIWPGVTLPPGDYSFHDHGIEFRGSEHRRLSGRIAYLRGKFYTGEMTRVFGNVTWTPSPRFRTRVGYDITDVEGILDVNAVPRDFTSRLITTSLDFVFSSTLSWVNLIQYDNFSERIGINMRLHWIPEAGREIYFVINHELQDFVDRDNRFDSLFSDATVKVNYTFRF
ncbi:MAG TPA: sugar-binding protein [Gammaproteobacteria bacterium]